MITTNDLVNVLEKYNHRKVTVSIEKNRDASDIWNTLIGDCVYLPYTIVIEKSDGKGNTESHEYDGFKYDVSRYMQEFSENDDLSLINKSGKLLKRLAKYLQIQLGYKVPDNIMGIIGDKLQYRLSNDNKEFTLDTSDVIDWDDGMYGKRGSCWWGIHDQSKEVFTDNGGWGIRFYDDMNDSYGIGRTWILPRDNMLICFNSYGVERPSTSKAIKKLFSDNGITLHYKITEVKNRQNDCIPYINGDSGFILYPDDMNKDDVPDSYDIDMEVENDDREVCTYCGDRTDLDCGTIIGDDFYCDDCIDRHFTRCDACEEYYRDNDWDVNRVVDNNRHYTYLCRHCADNKGYVLCENCEYLTDDYIVTDDTSECYCSSCQDEHAYYCESCEEWNSEEHNHDDDDSEDSPLDTTGLTSDIESPIMKTRRNQDICPSITVYRVNGLKGLFLYKFCDAFPDSDDDSWSIAHDVSGLAVKHDIENFNDAKRLLLALSEMGQYNSDGGWNRTAGQLQDDRPFLDNASQIIKSILG